MELQKHEVAYKQLAEDPERWMSSARSLLAASEELWVSVEADLSTRQSPVANGGGDHADVAESHSAGKPFLQHAAVFLMIAGFAIENALKALRVKQAKPGLTAARTSGVVSKDLLTHDLRRLATEAGVTLSPAENALLERLQAYLTWAGRYPVAATAHGQAAVQNIWGSDKVSIETLFKRIESMFQAE